MAGRTRGAAQRLRPVLTGSSAPTPSTPTKAAKKIKSGSSSKKAPRTIDELKEDIQKASLDVDTAESAVSNAEMAVKAAQLEYQDLAELSPDQAARLKELQDVSQEALKEVRLARLRLGQLKGTLKKAEKRAARQERRDAQIQDATEAQAGSGSGIQAPPGDLSDDSMLTDEELLGRIIHEVSVMDQCYRDDPKIKSRPTARNMLMSASTISQTLNQAVPRSGRDGAKSSGSTTNPASETQDEDFARVPSRTQGLTHHATVAHSSHDPTPAASMLVNQASAEADHVALPAVQPRQEIAKRARGSSDDESGKDGGPPTPKRLRGEDEDEDGDDNGDDDDDDDDDEDRDEGETINGQPRVFPSRFKGRKPILSDDDEAPDDPAPTKNKINVEVGVKNTSTMDMQCPPSNSHGGFMDLDDDRSMSDDDDDDNGPGHADPDVAHQERIEDEMTKSNDQQRRSVAEELFPPGEDWDAGTREKGKLAKEKGKATLSQQIDSDSDEELSSKRSKDRKREKKEKKELKQQLKLERKLEKKKEKKERKRKEKEQKEMREREEEARKKRKKEKKEKQKEKKAMREESDKEDALRSDDVVAVHSPAKKKDKRKKKRHHEGGAKSKDIDAATDDESPTEPSHKHGKAVTRKVHVIETDDDDDDDDDDDKPLETGNKYNKAAGKRKTAAANTTKSQPRASSSKQYKVASEDESDEQHKEAEDDVTLPEELADGDADTPVLSVIKKSFYQWLKEIKRGEGPADFKPPPYGIRGWVYYSPTLFPEAATTSREVALACMVSGQGTLLCRYHTRTKKSVRERDLRDGEEGLLFGRPWDAIHRLDWQALDKGQKPGKAAAKRFVQSLSSTSPRGWVVPGWKRFPGRDPRAMDCGCYIEDVLLEFYLWKTGRFTSPVMKMIDHFGRDLLKPRQRAFLLGVYRSETKLDINDIYSMVAVDGKWVHRPKTYAKRLQAQRVLEAADEEDEVSESEEE
ncbi:hypothetical protein VNI00_001722 [Paramarasmius palmivorus]|uniref:Uncharacterized protein n=1 Tax=Paramarasmius palmivorus TaxID=297713 RepID=A0AAW0E536_9AGAR